MRSFLVPVAAMTLAATSAQAKTEVEIVFDMLTYTDTTIDESSDDVDQDAKDTSLATVSPAFDLNFYADNISIRFDVDATDGNESSGASVGFLMSPNLYVGGFLSLENSKTTTSTKPDGGEKSETKNEDNSMTIGPFLHYRTKTSAQMIEAEGALGMVNTKEKTTSDAGTGPSTETTEKTEAMVLGVGGNFRKNVFDRVYLGAGLSYVMSLSGESEDDDGTTTTDSDFDIRELKLTLLDMLVEF